MKIFLTGPWWDTGSWTEYVAAGFVQLGHDVRTFIYSRELNRALGFRERFRRKLLGAGRFFGIGSHRVYTKAVYVLFFCGKYLLEFPSSVKAFFKKSRF